MPSYTYTGPDESITLRGVTFPNGAPVEIDDKGFESKLDNLPYFDSDKPKEVVKPVAVSDSEKDVEISQLRRELDRTQTEVRFLRSKLAEYEEAEAEPEPTPVEVTPDEEVISEYTPGEPEPELVAIPDDWREWHWKRQMVLAKKFTDMEINNQSDAVTAIEMELESRGG